MSYVLACVIVAITGPLLFSWLSNLVGPMGTMIAFATLGVAVWLLIDLVQMVLLRVGSGIGAKRCQRRGDDSLPKAESTRADTPLLNQSDAKSVQTAVTVLKRPRVYKRRWGQVPPKVVVIRGRDGSGRTLLAKQLARQLGKTRAYHLDTITYEGPWSNATFVRDTFRAAGRRSVVIVDHAFITNDHVATALNEEIRKGRALTVIKAKDEALHAALRGLLHLSIELTKPNEETREALFERFTRPYKKRLGCELEPLIEGSAGLYGEDLANLCRRAAQNAATKGKDIVTYRDFDRAFKELGRELPPSASVDAIYRVDCFMCGGGDSACPVCQGSGWTKVVKRHQAA